MDFLLALPTVVKLTGSLVIILLLNALRVPLAFAALSGAGVLAFLAGFGPWETCLAAGDVLSEPKTWMLLTVVFQVIWLGNQLAETGITKELVRLTGASLSARRSSALLPAVIGFLPMPGGALFSAPMVAACDPDGRWHNSAKAQINYWFRHVWEFWWPMYPGVLTAIFYSGLSTGQFVLLTLPLTFVAIVVGRLLFLSRLPIEAGERPVRSVGAKRRFLYLISPILVVVAGYAVVSAVWPALHELGFAFIPLTFGLLYAAVWLQTMRPLPRAALRKVFWDKKAAMMALLVLILTLYGGLTQAADATGQTMTQKISLELRQWGLPLFAVVAFLPFFSGLTTGIAVGMVSASFPVVIPLLAPEEKAAGVLTAFAFGYVGMMLSPIHVCYVVTAEYFHARLPALYGRVAAACFLVCLAAVGLAWAWSGKTFGG